MSLIYKSKSFDVVAAKEPHIDRAEGGHIVIFPRRKVSARQELSPKEAMELMRLTVVVGQAMDEVMQSRGVDIGRINYQDNGNWSVFKSEGPLLHMHLYGRAKSAKTQHYGLSLNFPHKDEHPEFYAKLQPLTDGDIKAIREKITSILKADKFSGKNWGEL